MRQESAATVVDRARIREDSKAIRAEVIRTGWLHWVLRTVGVLVILWLFWRLAERILHFGHGISYDRLGLPDSAIVGVLTRVNPYIWWVVVAVLGLIVLAILRSLWAYAVQRERSTVVPSADLQELTPRLSTPVLEVLAWVWRDRSQPLTQGDLRRTLAELRGGRVELLAMAREQAAILGVAPEPLHVMTGRSGPELS